MKNNIRKTKDQNDSSKEINQNHETRQNHELDFTEDYPARYNDGFIGGESVDLNSTE